jgi:hypothetical protein
MLFQKQWVFILFGILGLAGGTLNADEGQTGWLKTITQKTLPQNSPDDKPATVAGTRGLNEPAETVDTTVRDDAAIERLDKVTVTSEAVSHFIAEGKLQ